MIADNLWHPAVLAQKKEGGFELLDTIEQAEGREEEFTGRYADVLVNWNHGQPLVRTENGMQASIVDVDVA